MKNFYSYSGYTQLLTRAFFLKLMHILSIGNNKRLQAAALEKSPQSLKNLDILGRAELK